MFLIKLLVYIVIICLILLLMYRFSRNFLLLFFSIVLVIFFIEVTSFIVIKIRNKHACFINKNIEGVSKNLYDDEQDDYMGYVLKKSNTHRAVKTFLDGAVIYDVKYTTDQWRRRDVGQRHIKKNPHLLLFGCSLVYGVGLKDNETLQYMLQEGLPSYNIYNYAVYGYGPQHMLALLEKGSLPNEVYSNEGIAVCVFAGGHIGRAIGSTSTPWMFTSPYYYLNKNGQLQRKGSFNTGRVVVSKIYSTFLKIKSKSKFLQLIDFNLPFRISKKDIRITYEIIAESKRQYEKQFNGRFYVLLPPFSLRNKETKELVKLFEINNINVLYYCPAGDHKQYQILGDGHYNAELNKFLSYKLINSLF